jgi:hypothetical protein
MTSASVDFPCLGLAHSPYLDQSIIPSGNNQREGGMKRHPVDPSVMALENEFYYGIGIPEHVCLILVLTDRFLEGH